MRVFALLAVALALAGCAGSGWQTWHGRGVSIRLPPGWQATSESLTDVAWPAQFLAVASYRLPHSHDGADGCEPKAAVDRLPANGAFLFGLEYLGAPAGLPGRVIGVFPPRPRRFRLTHFGISGCLANSYLLRFREAGRYLQVYVVLGRRAGTRTRTLALRVLDSLVVERR
jgi:hypothetical protein